MTKPAAADSASWVSVGGGASRVKQDGLDLSPGGLIQIEAGLGTDPNSALVFGGLMKTLSHLGGGTDLILSERTTTSGFSLGTWGVALDLGGYARFWRDNSTGFAGALALGMPLGVNLSLQGQVGTENSQMLGFSLGFDWARFTAHRSSGESFWPNYRLPLAPGEQARR